MTEKRNFLSMTIVFQAANLNYGESVGNILSLKKLSSEGKNFSYISRQALRYDIVRMLNEAFDFELTEVNKNSGVILFSEEAKIDAYPEIDFFGYMKTSDGNKIRKAVVRLTDAISLEPFNNDLEFGTNKGLADRIVNNEGNDIFQAEIHKSLYTYTVSFNLDLIGKDDIYNINLPTEEKAKRVRALLLVLKMLYRDIRGKRENLSPVFVIGGLYDSGNPFFYNRIRVSFGKGTILLDTSLLNDVLSYTTFTNTVRNQTRIGYNVGFFSNVEEINLSAKSNIEEFFNTLISDVDNYYKG